MTSGQQVTKIFTLKGTNGAVRNADSLPVVKLFKEEVETSVSVLVTPVSTGHYAAKFQIPSTWVVGDTASLKVLATIQGFNQEAFITCFVIEEGADELVDKIWKKNISTITDAGSAAKELKGKLDKKKYIPPFI